ncbi:MAG TPA: PCMD domain-containing protein [Chitinophaga sp.]|uniref:PCMD domain-containing protein n=1 Tax=Chitinophaga sp. TaxID=1869181 RepID=UPI002B7A9B26|nr:PCMD domain-containing protein [Chitinophaga sp.]HVI45790.1 PCMD domain-containing protein [Chitinophaga sp.]
MKIHLNLKNLAFSCSLLSVLTTGCKRENISVDNPPAANSKAHTEATSLPNPGFESWNGNQPLSWNLSASGSARATGGHSGQYAAQIWNWYYYVKGFLTNGNVFNAMPGYDYNNTGGIAVSERPAALTGYYKYEPGSNDGKKDSAIAIIALRKYNAATRKSEKVAYTEVSLGPSSQYKLFRIPVSYASSVVPDSLVVTFISSRNGFCSGASNGNCLYLTLDDLALECSSGKKEIAVK